MCYAAVVADLVGFNQGLSSLDQISILDVGVNYFTIPLTEINSEISKIPEDQWTLAKVLTYDDVPELIAQRTEYNNLFKGLERGGRVGLAIAAYNARGSYCSENTLLWSSLPSVLKFEYFNTEDIRSLQEAATPMSLIKSPSSGIADKKSLINSILEIQPVSKDSRVSRYSAIQAKLDSDCAPRKLLKRMKYKSIVGSGLAQDVAKILANGAPVGISFDSAFLSEGRGKSIPNAQHSSIIVGSRWNTKKNLCEFKLRNSWGLYCGYYTAEFKEICKMNNGYVWINDADVNDKVDQLDFIERQP